MAVTNADVAVALRIVGSPTDTIPAGVDAILTRLRGTATALVEKYAEDAPDTIKDEAAIRVAGWLYDRPPDAATRGHSAMLHSGAQSLLAPWRDPGVGVTDAS